MPTPDSPPPLVAWPPLARWAGFLCAGALYAGWLGTVSGVPAPGPLASALAWAAVATGAVAGGSLLWALVATTAGGGDRAGGRLLAALVVLSFAVRFAGLDHEIVDRPYLDEGTYYKYARAIDGGDVFPRSFVYPHLLFYLQAQGLWLLDRLQPVSGALLRAVSRAEAPLEVEWLVLRLVAATLCALATIPVFLGARRLAALARSPDALANGRLDIANLGGSLAALLLIANAHYDSGAHLDICDAPSGAFAVAVVWLCGVLLAVQETAASPVATATARRRRWLYVAAGVLAGCAAATKYPAGVVAVAIVAVAVHGLLAARRLRLDLLWAGLAAIGAFVAAMPALLVHAERVFGGGRDILFGVRQYAGGGWIGVQPPSNTGYYASNLLASIGAPALLLALVGLVLAPSALRRHIGWLAAYPVAFLFLLVNMTMVVKRNLFPVIPALCLLLGPLVAVAVVRLAALARRRFGLAAGGTGVTAATLVIVALALPVWSTGLQTLGYVRASTRELAAAWIRANLPPGAGLVKESYTPDFAPTELQVRQTRFAARIPPEELRAPPNDYLLLASSAFERFLDEEKTVKEHQQEFGERYRRLRQELPRITVFAPGAARLGPVLELYRIEPSGPVATASVRWTAADAFLPDGPLTRTADGVSVILTSGHWTMVKGALAAGRWRCRSEHGGEAAGRLLLRAVDAANHELARTKLEPDGTLDLRPTGQVFLYLEAIDGTTWRSLACERVTDRGA